MSSTEATMIWKIADILRSNLTAEQINDELALLFTWSYLCDTRYPEGRIVFDEQQPDLKSAYQKLAAELGEAGKVFADSRLHSACTGEQIATIVRALNEVEKDPRRLAEALLYTASKSKSPAYEGAVSASLASLLYSICKEPSHSLVLNYPASAAVLNAVEDLTKVVYRTPRQSPLSVALSILLDANVELMNGIFEEPSREKADVVISVPPLAAREPRRKLAPGQTALLSDEFAILKTVEETRKRGVVLATPGVLFRNSTYEIRQNLIKNNHLDAVIGLPRGVLSITNIPLVMLVIDKTREPDAPVVFLDAEEFDSSLREWQSLAEMVNTRQPGTLGTLSDAKRIRDNDFDLTISRYKLGPATEQLSKMKDTAPLGKVADIIRAQNITPSDDNAEEHAEIFLEAAVRDISESGQLTTPEKQVPVAGKLQKRALNQRIQAGDILLVIKGGIGRVAFVAEDCGDNWIAGQVFLVIRPRDREISTSYLFRYLSSELVQAYLQEISTGSAMTILKASDVTDLPVPMPDSNTRKAVDDAHQAILDEYKAIQEHRDTIRRLEQQYWAINAESRTSRS